MLLIKRPAVHKFLPLLSAFCFVSPAGAGVFAQADLDQAYAYLNTLRQAAAMIPFNAQPLLQQSAVNHANYLVTHATTGHTELKTLSGFTGATPTERALAAGFSSRLVGENLSTGSASSQDSLDSLFTAIYHRLGLLSFDFQLVGIGISRTSLDNPQHTAYVYEAGNQGLYDFCAAGVNSSVSWGVFFAQVCANADLRIAESEYNAYLDQVRGQNPDIVLWPPRNGTDVLPAFFEESPDPLPDFSVSGNPLSIQFNPLKFSSVTVESFRLFLAATNTELTNTRLFQRSNDPNSKLSALEFALFPLERLAWNTEYRAEVRYSANNSSQSLSWTFRTRDPGMPIISAAAQGESFAQPAHSGRFAVYVPPTAKLPSISSYNYLFSNGLEAGIELLDGNTLAFDVRKVQAGQVLKMSIGATETFTINFDTKAIFNTANNSLSLPAVEVLDAGRSQGRVAVQMQVVATAPDVLVQLNGGLGAVDSNSPTVASYDAQSAQLRIPALSINGQSLSITLALVANSNPLQFKLVQ